METALLTHLDNITSLEQEEVELRTKLASITEEHGTHTRVIGLPEDIEGNNLRQFMADLFKEVAGGAIKLPPWTGPGPPQPQTQAPSRLSPNECAFSSLHWKRECCNGQRNTVICNIGVTASGFMRTSALLWPRRAAFNKVKSMLFRKRVWFGMIYPAWLWVTFNGVNQLFDSPEQAQWFYQEHIHTVTHEEWTSDIAIRFTWLYGSSFLFLFDGLHKGKTRLWCLN